MAVLGSPRRRSSGAAKPQPHSSAGAKRAPNHRSQRGRAAQSAHRARCKTRGSLTPHGSWLPPMTRQHAVTVPGPGASRAPTTKPGACAHTGFENSGAHAPSRGNHSAGPGSLERPLRENVVFRCCCLLSLLQRAKMAKVELSDGGFRDRKNAISYTIKFSGKHYFQCV